MLKNLFFKTLLNSILKSLKGKNKWLVLIVTAVVVVIAQFLGVDLDLDVAELFDSLSDLYNQDLKTLSEGN